MHGGDLFGKSIELDASVNVNPLGAPEAVKQELQRVIETELECYPDPHHRSLKQALSKHFQLEVENILCGNGASELIHAICQSQAAKSALLLAPCFSGYTTALRTSGTDIFYCGLRAKEEYMVTEPWLIECFFPRLEEVNPELVFITNPNNPNGACIPGELLRRMLKACCDGQRLVVLDECFLELTDCFPATMIREIQQYPNLVVLRAFTKSFALPGLRLGYGICQSSQLCESIERQLPEWNVSVLAERAGVVALREQAYLEEARTLIGEERAFLEKGLKALDFVVFPGNANFILFYDEREKRKETWKEAMEQKKILIRDCSDYEGLTKGYYRIAVKSHTENQRLLKTIEDLMER